MADVLELFHPVTAEWFRSVFDNPTAPQRLGWPAIARRENTLILAPTGTGKTLAAFLWCLNRLMLDRGAVPDPGCRVLYVSPLKALAVDVERNLQLPLAGMMELARRRGVEVHPPQISIRTGDTSQQDRGRFRRHPSEILITTPESLYLLLTSDAAATLRRIDTVILDEIHALVPTKRGAHLALSLERLEALAEGTIQRIGLSATQRPLEEVARFLSGVKTGADSAPVAGRQRVPLLPAALAQENVEQEDVEREEIEQEDIENDSEPVAFRPVTIVDARERKKFALRIEVPVEDMARPSQPEESLDSRASAGPKRTSIWSAIYPRLVEIVRQHRSTIIFANSRRLAERLAGAINEFSGEQLARAHHGSLARAQRTEIEEQLKTGRLRALVATSSLELGIDMGAVDLVVQIESPPSIASAMQRIGRAGHRAGAVSEGVILPKFRADLVACAAITRAMHEGLVESTRFLRNPLDVLAQQIVAIVAQPPASAISPAAGLEHPPREIAVETLYRLVRGSAPFCSLTRKAFFGVLDLLSGHYPSDEFAELRPRITWDRERNVLTPRAGAKMLAILNGGTIPDRGLYGVFLIGSKGQAVRVGELDEEMVYESRTGDVFMLGASSWRIDEITHDRVLVSPAPGQPGKMPFWHGDAAGRPLEFGRRIGQMVRELRALPQNAALSRLVREHDLDAPAAENLLRFLADQQIATLAVPDDRTIVIERLRDELGDWRICVLTPFGSRVHAPWAMAVSERILAAGGPAVDTMWGDDGFLLRFPDTDIPPDTAPILLDPEQAAALVLRQLGATALFAAKFRENAARALLLPRRRAQGRAPLWQQRKRASDLLSVAARYPSFPILLETYRECMRDVFDIPALLETLRAVRMGDLQVHVADTRKPSPYASSLLFSYVINSIYDGDAPLAERRAQALSIDQDQLRELLGETDLRELLDADAIAQVEQQLQCLGQQEQARSADALQDMLLRIGDLSREEILARLAGPDLAGTISGLLRARRLLEVEIAAETRFIAVEDAARYRDALGTSLPAGLPPALLQPVQSPVLELVRRFARTHAPFTLQEVASRFSLKEGQTEGALHALVLTGRLVEGGFRPGGVYREWCDREVLRLIRSRSLARLRREVEPIGQEALARLETHWQGVLTRRRGLDALLDAIEQLQGVPLPASIVERAILPARLDSYSPGDLDTLIAAGEVSWCGVDTLGEHDGRIALFLADKLPLLLPQRAAAEQIPRSPRESALLDQLAQNGAAFFTPLYEAAGGGYPGETLEALWNLVWRGEITNDTFHALRAYISRPVSRRASQRRQHPPSSFRSRRTTPPSGQGRWTLLPPKLSSSTAWSYAAASQLLRRYGVVTRESVAGENLPGGFSAIYDVLKALEERGSIRRGYFVAGLGAAQFALPAAVDLLRSLRSGAALDKSELVFLAAADPANPYGAVLRWPAAANSSTGESDDGPVRTLARSVGASVILRNGALLAYLRGANSNLQVFLPEEEPDRSHSARDLARLLAAIGREQMQRRDDRRQGMLIPLINGQPARSSFLARFLEDAGFHSAAAGFHLRRTAESESFAAR